MSCFLAQLGRISLGDVTSTFHVLLDNCGVETDFGDNDDFLIDALWVMDAADAVIEAMLRE